MFKNKATIFLLFFIFIPFLNALAQDSTNVVWEEEFEINCCDENEAPFIEFNYGLGNSNLNNLIRDFSSHSLLEFKLGHYKIDSTDFSSLIKYGDCFTFVSNISTQFNPSSYEPAKSEIELNTWRFGFEGRSGYGYNFGALSLTPYYSWGINWAKLNYSAPTRPSLLPDETEMLKRFKSGIRFGTINEAGVLLSLGNSFSLSGGYEYALLFPRYLIWKHLGSVGIELTAFACLNSFIDEIAERSPIATPLVNFLLKNALSYGLFSLRKEKMYWPFASESPLTTRIFKVGVTFKF